MADMQELYSIFARNPLILRINTIIIVFKIHLRSTRREEQTMEKKDLDWGNIGFSYMPTDKRYVAN
ncbi:MAG: branched chain amino acid aminotransferase, partial [Hungatella sp.]